MKDERSEEEERSYLWNTFSWVDDDNTFAGSSCPGLNSPMHIDAMFLRQFVNGVISLNDAELDWSPLTLQGIKQYSVSVQDYKSPSVEQLGNIINFVESLGERSAVLVHCNAGMGRTGTVLASLLVWKYKLTANDAIKQVRALRKGSVQTYKQEEGVRAWAEYLKTTTT